MNSVSPSFHSLLLRSNVRGVEATVKFATAAPEGVKRNSGSPVRLPMMVMVVSLAMAGLLESVVDQASARSSLVRMTSSESPSWRSNSLAVAGSEVNRVTT